MKGKGKNMLNYNLFCVYTTEDKTNGLFAVAEKISATTNIANFVKNLKCVHFSICRTWKDAVALAEKWNNDFLANGNQKKIV